MAGVELGYVDAEAKHPRDSRRVEILSFWCDGTVSNLS